MRALLPLVLTAAWISSACGSETPAGPPITILVTLDTTRADHIGAYGYAAAKTPHLDRIASEGALFTDVSATAPTTLPSHASILTGLFPPSHGARNNGNHSLPEEVESMAEVFSRAGYATGAFLAAEVLAARYGLNQGFDHYDDDFLRDVTSFGDGYRERSARTIVERAKAWISRSPQRPVFAWLHFFDPHFPYNPSPDHAHPYDAEIARVDEALGELIDALKTMGRYGNATVAIVADHGEGLGDKGEDTHGLFVYQATIRVPLLLRAPQQIPKGTRIDEPVSTVDLAPTLLELAGLKPSRQVQGRSLSPLWNVNANASPAERRIYFETLLPRYEYMWSNLAGMRAGTHKFISAPTDELYQLEADPGESENLLASSESDSQWALRFQGLVGGFPPPPSSASMNLDSATRETMAALGYGFAPLSVDTLANTSGEGRGVLPDPKANLAKHHLYRKIQGATRDEDWSLVIELTAKGLRGTSFDAYQALFAARAHASLAQHRQAENIYRMLLGSFPADTTMLRGLASVQFDMKQFAEARSTYVHLVELDALHPQHHAGLGDCQMALGNAALARKAWESALVADPYFVKAWNNLGIMDAQSGEFDAARTRFERILAIDPGHEQARNNLRRLSKDVQTNAKTPTQNR